MYRVTQGLKVKNAYLIDKYGGQARNRTMDMGIFSFLLYQLSYLASELERVLNRVWSGQSSQGSYFDGISQFSLNYQ